MYTYVYIYIYTWPERETERERDPLQVKTFADRSSEVRRVFASSLVTVAPLSGPVITVKNTAHKF